MSTSKFFIITFVYFFLHFVSAKYQTTCPVNFYVTQIVGKINCLRTEEPVVFKDRNRACLGGYFAVEKFFYNDTKEIFSTLREKSGGELKFWIDAVRSYKDGPFVIWNMKSTRLGKIILLPGPESAGDCIVYNTKENHIEVVSCETKAHYLCSIKPYEEILSRGPCKEKFYYLADPVASCVSKAYFTKDGLNRTKSRKYCLRSGGDLIQSGCIYSNNVFLLDNKTTESLSFPLGMEFLSNGTVLTNYKEHIQIIKRYNVINQPFSKNKTPIYMYGERQNHSVDPGKDLLFNKIFCEHRVSRIPDKIILVNSNGRLLAWKARNHSVETVVCFTDGSFDLKKVNFITKNFSSLELNPKLDGYYWCLDNNTKDFVEQSQKIWWSQDKEPLNTTGIITFKIYSTLTPKPIFNTTLSDKLVYTFDHNRMNFSEYYKIVSLLKKNNITSRSIKRIFNNGLLIVRHTFPVWPNNTHWTAKDFNFTQELTEEIFNIKNPIYCNHLENERINGQCITDVNNGAHWIKHIENNNSNIEYQQNVTSCLNMPINAKQLDSYAKCFDRVIDLKKPIQNITGILKEIDTMLNQVEIDGNKKVIRYSYPNMIMAAAEINTDDTHAIKVEYSGQSENITFIKTAEELQNNTDDAAVVVKLSGTLRKKTSQRVSVVITNSSSIFDNKTEYIKVNSIVVGISVPEKSDFEKNIDIYFRPLSEVLHEDEAKVCAYWDDEGRWSTKCCEIITDDTLAGMDRCRCYHMTHFAQLIVKKSLFVDDSHQLALTVITYVGCFLSFVGILAVLATAGLSKTWRRKFDHKIVLNLSLSMLALVGTFFMSAYLKVSPKRNANLCTALGVTLHYSILSTFFWMLVSAVQSYKLFVVVFKSAASHQLQKACLVGWVIPLVLVAGLAIFDPESYAREATCNDMPDNFCYPSGVGFWTTVFLPIFAIVSVNAVIFAFVIEAIFKKSKARSTKVSENTLTRVKIALLLFFLFGLTWIFGLLSESVIMNYLFCLSASAQGFILFVFRILANDEARKVWSTRRKQTSIPMN